MSGPRTIRVTYFHDDQLYENETLESITHTRPNWPSDPPWLRSIRTWSDLTFHQILRLSPPSHFSKYSESRYANLLSLSVEKFIHLSRLGACGRFTFRRRFTFAFFFYVHVSRLEFLSKTALTTSQRNVRPIVLNVLVRAVASTSCSVAPSQDLS